VIYRLLLQASLKLELKFLFFFLISSTSSPFRASFTAEDASSIAFFSAS
jgi:hypothetical protein